MKTAVRRTLATVALATVAVGTLTACGEDAPAEFDAAEQSAAQNGDDAGTATEPVTNDAKDADPADKAPSDAEADIPDAEPVNAGPVGPDDAIETITYDLPGAEARAEATVTVGLHSLRHEGDVMVLELSFTPEFRGDGKYSIYKMHDRNSISPVINDRANLKQYTVLGGYNGWQTETGPIAPEASSGQTLKYWGYFAAPEDDIDTVSVGVGMVEFTDVTIER